MTKLFNYFVYLFIIIALPVFVFAQSINIVTRNLYLGIRNPEVTLLQQKLQELGYFPKTIQPTGYFGPITKKAVQAFQKVHSVPATGYVGPLTRNALGQTTVLAPASLKIIAPSSGGIYLGSYNHLGTGVADFEKAVGKKIAIYPQGPGTACKDGGTEGTLPKIDIACRETLRQQGYVSSYGIEAYLQGGSFSNQDIIDGKIDTELKIVARDIANWGKPIFWFYHREPYAQFGGYGASGGLMIGQCAGFIRPTTGDVPPPTPAQVSDPCNYNQFGDPSKLDGPERYIVVARRIHDIVENEIKAFGKQSPITWVMGGIIEYQGKFEPKSGFYTAYYPGNAYVDWHAFDWYPGFDAPVATQYVSLSTFPGWKEAMQLAPDKPVLIMEFGVHRQQGGDNPTGNRLSWYNSFFNDVKTNPAMKNLVAFLYWQETGGGFNTRLAPSDPEASLWQQEIQVNPNFWYSKVQTSGTVTPPPPTSNKTPIGWLDVIDANGNASGWALNPDASSQSIDVHFYIDGPAGTGVFAGSTTANLLRLDVNQVTGYSGNHGFTFSIPSSFRDGKPHQLYVHGIDTSGNGNQNVLLSGVPKSFTLSGGSVSSGATIQKFSFFSNSLQKQMTGIAILPSSYSSSTNLPVLYMLPGLAQKPDDMAQLVLPQLAEQYGFVVIVPDNGDKCLGSESGCVGDTAFVGGWHTDWYNPSSLKAPSNPALFESYIMKDVVGYAENNYKIRTDKNGRGIMGISMGGYGAMKYGMKYKSFAFVASHSGQIGNCHLSEGGTVVDLCGPFGSSFQKANDAYELAKGCTQGACGKIYFDTGFSDPNYQGTSDFSAYLTSINIGHYYEPAAGGHDNAFWNSRLPRSIGLFAASVASSFVPSTLTGSCSANACTAGLQNLSIAWSSNDTSLNASCGGQSMVTSGGSGTSVPLFCPASPTTCTFTSATGKTGSFSCTISPTTSQTATKESAFVSQTVPAAVGRGAPFGASLTFKNTGTATWRASEGYKLGSQNPQDNSRWGMYRVSLSQDVLPGVQVTFTKTFIAPEIPGTYNFQWKMLKEGVAWFGQASENFLLRVGG